MFVSIPSFPVILTHSKLSPLLVTPLSHISIQPSHSLTHMLPSLSLISFHPSHISTQPVLTLIPLFIHPTQSLSTLFILSTDPLNHFSFSSLSILSFIHFPLPHLTYPSHSHSPLICLCFHPFHSSIHPLSTPQ